MPVPPLVPGVRERGSVLLPGPVWGRLRVPPPERQPRVPARELGREPVRRLVRVRLRAPGWLRERVWLRAPGWLPAPVAARLRALALVLRRVWVRLRAPVLGERGQESVRLLVRVRLPGAQVRELVPLRVRVRVRVLWPVPVLPPGQQPLAPVPPPGQLPVPGPLRAPVR
ncbi:hypothetical protein ACFY9A_07045 [Streptomyces rubradiris]|uniref:hypothetical protein n=1 Tax=Streptomyces rubradiris TaxID=285531 RepID=UPI0036E122B3